MPWFSRSLASTEARARAAGTLAIALALALGPGGPSCYRPRKTDCVLTCQQASDCPRGLLCADGLCTGGASCTLGISAGETHSCAVYQGGVKCWGGNGDGQLGNGTRDDVGVDPAQLGDGLARVELGDGRIAVAVSAGGRHTCALLAGGAVVCWGGNDAGQLGRDDRRARWRPADLGAALEPINLGAGEIATSISAGLGHTCAVLESGALKCWGDNRFGQLGLGAPGNRGDDAGEMAALPRVVLWPAADAPARVLAVAAGAYHTCALLDGGTVKCWGWNERGQLGVGDVAARGLAAGDMGGALPAVPLGTRNQAVQIAAGAFHSCAVVVALPAGAAANNKGGRAEVRCWGANQSGQLGIGSGTDRGSQPSAPADTFAPVPLGGGLGVRTVVAGAAHTCALLDDFSVRCWGFGRNGQLGAGTAVNLGRAPDDISALRPVMLGQPHVGATSIAAGADHTCAVHGARPVCWGLGARGRLGTGQTGDRGGGTNDGALPVPVDLGSR